MAIVKMINNQLLVNIYIYIYIYIYIVRNLKNITYKMPIITFELQIRFKQ